MKSQFISFLLLISLLCTSLESAEYGQLQVSEAASGILHLESGDVFEIIGYNTNGDCRLQIELLDGTLLDWFNFRAYGNGGPSKITSGTWETILKFVVGPCTVWLKNSGGAKGIASYKLTRASEVKTVTNSITIPAITNQEWAVTLERSTDLTNWETVAPGTVTGTDSLQFFRIRVGGETTTVESTSTGGE